MLQHTFCHIPGIGHATEQRLWQQGVTCWQHLLLQDGPTARVSRQEICRILELSALSLAADPLFFATQLKAADAWRLFPHFRATTAYLDIETTGGGPYAEITTIALYDGTTVSTYVNGINLDEFPDDIMRYSVLVSYSGRSFDIPIIEHFFRMRLPQAQIDLRYVLARLGYRGGLKGCEKQLGINRGMLDGIDGASAVLLWREYERYDNSAALQTLLAYNVEDTVNLERLMVEAYNRHVALTPFGPELTLDFPPAPQLHHQPDPDIVQMLKASCAAY